MSNWIEKLIKLNETIGEIEQEVLEVKNNLESIECKESNSNNFESKVIKKENIKMTSLNVNPMKYLGGLPDFGGHFGELQNFIDLVDRIHPVLTTYDNLSQHIFSDVIRSKFKGRAREIIEINYHLRSWQDTKTLLVNNFGDRLSVDQLFDELKSINFRTHSQEFYNEVKVVLRRLNVKTRTIYENDQNNLELNIKANINAGLSLFKNKLPEPMKSIILCRNPDTLEGAMNILHESGYAFHRPSNLNRQRERDNNHGDRSNNFDHRNKNNSSDFNRENKNNGQRPNHFSVNRNNNQHSGQNGGNRGFHNNGGSNFNNCEHTFNNRNHNNNFNRYNGRDSGNLGSYNNNQNKFNGNYSHNNNSYNNNNRNSYPLNNNNNSYNNNKYQRASNHNAANNGFYVNNNRNNNNNNGPEPMDINAQENVQVGNFRVAASAGSST